MRALVFHGPREIRVEELPDPVPGPGEVLIRVTATGICGSDVHGYTGENGRRQPGQVMGHETVGWIEAAGAGVSDLLPGMVATVNPVIGCGACPPCGAGSEQLCARRRIIGVDPTYRSAFAELLAVPAGNVVVLPDGIPIEYGALVEPLSVGYHAAVRGGVGPDDRVLVIGGGPIGQACALAARRLGARAVAVSEPSRSRRELVSRLGFDALDPADLTDLDGEATVVLDAVGSSASLAAALDKSALGARIVLVGMNAPEVTLAAYAISTYERSVVGSFCYSSRDFRETAAWVGTRPDGMEHLVDGRAGLTAAPDAFAGLASGALEASKVLVYLGEA
jgi:threonine dehydrogenase-like Zn-dependent dehydrogenase